MDSNIGLRKIFIGGLSYATDDDKLRQYFEAFGPVQDAVVMKDPVSRRSRGFGFITFEHASYVDIALSQDVHTIDSRKVEAKRAVPRSEVSQTIPTPVKTTTPTSISSTSPADAKSNQNSDDYAYCKIFVGGLHYDTRDGEFRNYFEKYGRVISAEVMFNRETHKSRGFGFIVYENETSVDNVCAQEIHEIDGKVVEVKRAVPRSKLASTSTSSTSNTSGGSTPLITINSTATSVLPTNTPKTVPPPSAVTAVKSISKPTTVPVASTSSSNVTSSTVVDKKNSFVDVTSPPPKGTSNGLGSSTKKVAGGPVATSYAAALISGSGAASSATHAVIAPPQSPPQLSNNLYSPNSPSVNREIGSANGNGNSPVQKTMPSSPVFGGLDKDLKLPPSNPQEMTGTQSRTSPLQSQHTTNLLAHPDQFPLPTANASNGVPSRLGRAQRAHSESYVANAGNSFSNLRPPIQQHYQQSHIPNPSMGVASTSMNILKYGIASSGLNGNIFEGDGLNGQGNASNIIYQQQQQSFDTLNDTSQSFQNLGNDFQSNQINLNMWANKTNANGTIHDNQYAYRPGELERSTSVGGIAWLPSSLGGSLDIDNFSLSLGLDSNYTNQGQGQMNRNVQHPGGLYMPGHVMSHSSLNSNLDNSSAQSGNDVYVQHHAQQQQQQQHLLQQHQHHQNFQLHHQQQSYGVPSATAWASFVDPNSNMAGLPPSNNLTYNNARDRSSSSGSLLGALGAPQTPPRVVGLSEPSSPYLFRQSPDISVLSSPSQQYMLHPPPVAPQSQFLGLSANYNSNQTVNNNMMQQYHHQQQSMHMSNMQLPPPTSDGSARSRHPSIDIGVMGSGISTPSTLMGPSVDDSDSRFLLQELHVHSAEFHPNSGIPWTSGLGHSSQNGNGI